MLQTLNYEYNKTMQMFVELIGFALNLNPKMTPLTVKHGLSSTVASHMK